MTLFQKILPVAAAAAIFLATVALSVDRRARDDAALVVSVEEEAVALAAEIRDHVDEKIRALVRMGRRWDDQGRPEQGAWEADAANLIRDEKGYQAIEWVDATRHVRWVVPLQGNRAAVDLDLSFETRRREVLDQARAQRTVVVTRAVDLVQGGKGILAAVPLFSDEFDGFILGVFRIHTLLSSIVDRDAADLGFEVVLSDGGAEIFRDSGPGTAGDDSWAHTAPIEIHGVRWDLRVWPTLALIEQKRAGARTLLVLLIGVGVSVLVGIAIYLGQVARARAQDAESASLQLREAQHHLEERVDEATTSLRFALRELDHRVKNTLATVLSVSEQTLVSSESPEDFGIAFRGRIDAMARTHMALAQNERGRVDLGELVELAVAPYRRDDSSVRAKGPPLPIAAESVRVLGMAFHELATNAAKFGALSNRQGRVSISWRLEVHDAAQTVHVRWEESGGPSVAPITRRGFGSSLIEDAVAYELEGEVKLQHRESGLCWQIVFPYPEPTADGA